MFILLLDKSIVYGITFATQTIDPVLRYRCTVYLVILAPGCWESRTWGEGKRCSKDKGWKVEGADGGPESGWKRTEAMEASHIDLSILFFIDMFVSYVLLYVAVLLLWDWKDPKVEYEDVFNLTPPDASVHKQIRMVSLTRQEPVAFHTNDTTMNATWRSSMVKSCKVSLKFPSPKFLRYFSLPQKGSKYSDFHRFPPMIIHELERFRFNSLRASAIYDLQKMQPYNEKYGSLKGLETSILWCKRDEPSPSPPLRRPTNVI